jgi:Carboxypeptidase regulatory-like domain
MHMPLRRIAVLLSLLAAPVLVSSTARAVVEQGRGGATGQGRGPGLPPRDTPPADAPRGTAVIRGVVLAADTGTPIGRAQVRAFAPGIRDNRLATTDAQGRFEFRELAAGRYTITANKGGFVGLQYGQRRPSESGTPLEIGNGQLVDKLVIALPRGSVISGRIFDEFGEPVANAIVNAFRYGYAGGARRYLPAGGQNSRDTTDDQGAFRLFGLPPGEYIVSANFRGGGGDVTDPSTEPSGYAPTYFPGTPNGAEAQRVRVDVGQELGSVNFALIAARLVRISGTVIDSQGAPSTTANLVLMPADTMRGMPILPGGGARVDRTGAFRITGVAPGRYMLQASTNLARGKQAAGEGEFARLDIAVGAQDLDGVAVVTAPGARVTGQIVTDDGQPPAVRPDQIQVAARSARPEHPGFAGRSSTARVAADWTFSLAGLFDPALFRLGGGQGWSIKQVVLNGQDITDAPLEFTPGQTISGVQIVLTQKSTTLSGAVLDGRGRPVTAGAVVVFPAEERLWTYQSRFIRLARADQSGRYEIKGLPPYDDYRLAAVQEAEDGQAGDPEFLAALKPAAATLSLNEGETKAADAKLPAPR